MGEAKRRREAGATDQWTPNDVERVLMNPIHAGVAGYPPIINEEQWIKANAKLMAEKGAERYLRAMLALLQDTFPGG